MSPDNRVAILGGGNIGTAIADGLVRCGRFRPEEITITRRRIELLHDLAERGFQIKEDNSRAVRDANVIILAVNPQHLNELIRQIAPALAPARHLLISVVTGVSIREILAQIGRDLPVVRAMPNIAIAIQESMTALAGLPGSEGTLSRAQEIFDPLGKTVVLDEDQIVLATALCACGVAFFLRAIRAASQGGIEIGLHPGEALLMAAQTAKGAASLLLNRDSHPEEEIDKVTTPMGCTIAGLNRMEHGGFSSSMIRGIVRSAEKANQLYLRDNFRE